MYVYWEVVGVLFKVGGVLVVSRRTGTVRFFGTASLSNVCSQLCEDMSW